MRNPQLEERLTNANGIFRVVRVFRIKLFALKIYGETEGQ